MNRFRFQAFTLEFPFIEQLVDNSITSDIINCDGITVRRADDHMLNEMPCIESAIGSLVDIHNVEDVIFVLSDGSLVEGAVQQEDYLHSNYAHDDGHHYPGETIMEAIDRHGVSAMLKYIVVVSSGYEIVNHSSTKAWKMVIYKTPKATTFAEEIARAKTSALEQVRAESTF